MKLEQIHFKFPRVRLALFVAALLFFALACQHATAAGVGNSPSKVPAISDKITLPDVRREFVSPSSRYIFAVSTRDNWKYLRGTGELFSVSGSVRKLLWSRELPQQFGPRFVLVSDLGAVVMVDEWINVKTGYAVLIVDRDNRQVAQHGTDDVQAVLQVPINQIVQLAKHGWWISAPPILNASGNVALVKAAGKILAIRLSDGRLSIS